jgi:hypothetical protein
MPHSDSAAKRRVNAPTDRGYELVYIPVKQVSQVWPLVAGLIEAAMRRGDLSSFASVATAVMAGCAQLWVAVARRQGNEKRPSSRAVDERTRPGADRDHEIIAAAVTKLQQVGRRKLCIIVACGGDEITRWLDLLALIEDWAKSEGCDAMRIMGRRGWSRVLPAYRLTRIVLEKEL